MNLTPEVREQIASIVNSGPVVLFMKGNAMQPQCGFSARLVEILNRLVPSYVTFDVLSDPEIREGIKEFSDWPTIPQLYLNGEFQGGCDIVTEMYEEGELHQALGVAVPEVGELEITITDRAAPLLRDAQSRYPGDNDLHISIDASFQHSFGFGPRLPGQITVESNGFALHFDRDSAARANGLTIDGVPASGGARLTLSNPNSPAAQVRSMTPGELAALRQEEAEHRLLDVRTTEERERAQIDGSALLDDAAAGELEALPRDTKLVFYCHTGERSRAAAEHFARAGFTDVSNLEGGIDAWSRQVDAAVPRY